jgi:hypothetical protein
MTEEMLDDIEGQLKYGDSRSEWMCNAIDLRLQLEKTVPDDEDTLEYALEAVEMRIESEQSDTDDVSVECDGGRKLAGD